MTLYTGGPWQPGWSYLRYDYVHDQSYVYVNIPKNASCWMKENFGGYRYDYINRAFVDPVNSAITLKKGLLNEPLYIIILRDPIDRWLSGVAQFFHGIGPSDINHFTIKGMQWLFEKIEFDDHTRSQAHFIDHCIPKDRITWFYCDHQLVSDLRSWIQNKFDIPIFDLDQDPDNRYNVSARSEPITVGVAKLGYPDNTAYELGMSKNQIIDIVKTYIEHNHQCREKLMDYYAKDYDLINSVKFYGTR